MLEGRPRELGIARPRIGSPDPAAAIEHFWNCYARGTDAPAAMVDALVAAALAPEPERAAAGTRVLFDRVIEPLCDRFTPHGAAVYRKVFARVVTLARRTPECRRFDAALHAAGLSTEEQLLCPVATPRPLDPAARAAVESVVLLSRLTLGADVAICVPALRQLAALFPKATLHFVGGEGAAVLARCFARTRHAPIAYRRTATLGERLRAWSAVREAVLAAIAGLRAEQYVLVDPDSRLTQLGLLPPVPPSRYYHFPSRSYAADDDAPLGTLVGRWLGETFGAAAGAEGDLVLPAADAEWGCALRSALDRGCAVAAVSFGVGGNEQKRAGFAFEAQLLEWLVRRGYRVLLARGTGADEVERSRRLTAAAAERGIAALHLPPGRALDGLRASAAPIVTWEADVAAFFAAVSAADLYVGYDSAGQHIAAALGVPTLSVFVECAGPKHAARWRPCGPAPVQVVRSGVPPDQTRLLLRGCQAVRLLALERPLSGSRAPAA